MKRTLKYIFWKLHLADKPRYRVPAGRQRLYRPGGTTVTMPPWDMRSSAAQELEYYMRSNPNGLQ